jgi:hypothetical protein
LPDNPTGTNVEMADFRVAHKALREAHGKRRGFELRVALGSLRVFFPEAGHERCVGSGNGITFRRGMLGWDTPAIDND